MTSYADHPICPKLLEWKKKHDSKHDITFKIGEDSRFPGGDILFLICCSHIISSDIRALYKNTLLVHASNLPEGRGWSPVIWQVLEGRKEVLVTMLEAEDKVDTGKIWLQKSINFNGNELYYEINELHHNATLELMDELLQHYNDIKPRPQAMEGATYYPKRTPADSQLDPNKTIKEQFDILRVADPDRYPAFFEINNQKYYVKIWRA